MNQVFRKRKEIKLHSQTVAYMTVSGIKVQTRDMDVVTKYGPMARYMMVIGKMIKQMDAVVLFMQMAISMMVTGKTTRQMVSVFTSILKEHNMKDIGKMISNMEKVKKNGLMAPNMRAHTNTAKKKALAHLIGLMDRVTKVILSIITLMERELISGRMVVSSLVNGKTTKCTDEVCLSGQMVARMKANT